MAPDLLVGEWVFADDVFGDRIPPGEEYVERVLVRGATPDLARRIETARTRTAGYLDACAARILARCARASSASRRRSTRPAPASRSPGA